ncbi:5'-AMP-activated protein kinase subunit beta-1 [Eupeodes corollae]|uniref:5'-AMP-activated protein kinase subunit beta-1 n=1 Tax=Eupeodes corollae TaxID=290404 RepID=UPI00249246B7|nr:5'-AMP-activated protein kinase subunit beta-1 [Eupeodes corollae]
MGNAGSANIARERHKSADSTTPSSPFRDNSGGVLGGGAGGVANNNAIGGGVGGQAFVFDKKPDTRLVLHGTSQDDEEQPYYTKPVSSSIHDDSEFATPAPRQRSSTVSEGTTPTAMSASLAEAEDDPNKPALPTVLRWDGGGKQVLISGTFTNWKTLPMVRSHGNFVTIIDLPEGDHQYKFCVDGEWKHDPKLKSIDDPSGIKNNLVSVRQSDFEVFQALAKDSENVINYAEREYSQEVPQAKPWEKVSGPPVLPPHLLQVILNKDTPVSCEPTLLPEPNHVMLNHLYALSIKDGVMVLSATHRYRKKYVTTLLYKPI